MRRYIADLDERLVREAASHTHPFWGKHVDLATHTAFQFEQLRRAGPSILRYVGLVDDAAGLVASLKRYTLALSVPGGAVVSVVGFGAVFTRQDARKTGAASELIEAVLAEARAEGHAAGLLYSDIDPAFYARLGFHAFPVFAHAAALEALPARTTLSLRPAEDRDDEAMLAAYEASFDTSFLRPHRSLEIFRFFRWRCRAERPWILRAEDRDVGYLFATPRGIAPERTLWIDEWAAPGIDRAEVLGVVRQLAEREGARSVTGWLRPDEAAPFFDASPRPAEIPMIAPLDERLRPESVPPNRAFFGHMDHF
ncbi:GNAT family N-acetyltransferase [Polyangium aurulentum]|uniref:GNAT family N-acetyltransferase n=1 Tax=Polyangium aurulentum TaxID=2567896 RepID=UPI0010AEA9A7|nr:GNAT family N-acetyltransferase [Polyangium aurulentum]UQA57383.1 GNAT family N-acetyltransferase [Polyangium aurulentum]